MNYRSIWEKGEWTKQARTLVKGLRQFPRESKIIVIVRHSHRNSIQTLSDMAGLRLTLLGHEIAEIFGSNLPKRRSLRVFYSPIQRCKETAIGILEGFKKVSDKGILEEPIKQLYDIGVRADFFYKEITKYPEIQFLFRWVANLYPDDKVTPFEKYCQNAWNIILEKNKMASKRSIDIHVSHDLIILAYMLGWFGLSPNGKWPSFLGGFAFSINKHSIMVLDKNKIVNVEIPHWWEN